MGENICRAGILLLLIIFIGIAGCLNDELTTDTPLLTTDPIKGNYIQGEIPTLSAEAEMTATASLNEILMIPPDNRTFENTVIRFDTIITDYMDAINPLILMGMLHPDPVIAEEGIACEERSMIFLNEIYSRRDLYTIFSTQIPETEEEIRLSEFTNQQYEKNGLHLSDEQLKQVTALNAELASLESQYNANLYNDNTTRVFSPDELRGVPQSALSRFTKTNEGTYIVTMSYPDYNAVMTYADDNKTRKEIWTAYNNRQAEENTRLLEEAIILRQKIARELGYDTWADYQLDGRMAQNSTTVMAFLTSLNRPLREKTEIELLDLLLIKQGIDPDATRLDPWDITYLIEKRVNSEYAFNQEKVKEFFPVDRVIGGMFEICGSLYGIRFEEVTGTEVWSPDVQLFRLIDETDDSTIGYLYLDLFPREGKYHHYCTMNLIQGREIANGYAEPAAIIIGNFNPPGENTPSLLTIEECCILFHENGHALHTLLTKAPYGTLAGYDAQWDFVETPSQAFEEWIYDPEILESISGHYRDPSEKIPPEEVEEAIKASKTGEGIDYTIRLIKSFEDMHFHTADGRIDTAAVYRDLFEEMVGITIPEGIHQPASFSHLMDGYDAGYYSYLWSKVYAMNIVDRFKEDGMTNRTTGMAYQTTVLERGNMADGMVLLTDFLGEEPGIEPLNRFLGITE